MFHRNRVWAVVDIDCIEELARRLTETTHCLCQGFRYNGYLLLNDSLSEDGAQEYMVIDEARGVQVDSVTVSWMRPTRLEALMEEFLSGEPPEALYGAVDLSKRLVRHGYGTDAGPCPLCA